MNQDNIIKHLTPNLLDWFAANARTLPWREDPTPYHVWISEIMLQQTRVEAVKGYYTRFLTRYPDLCTLADTDPEELAKYWEGLGYYSRMRNILRCAKLLCEQYDSRLPSEYEALLKLPGIGSYTAGAIASIAYGKPVPAVDGNVLRVISRIFADNSPIDEPKTKTACFDLLYRNMPDKPGAFNQALMELGATVCLPNGAPLCDICPVNTFCAAYAAKTQLAYPVKKPKKARRVENITFLLIQSPQGTLLRKREDTGLLAGLWEYPNLTGALTEAQVRESLAERGILPERIERLPEKKHIFTHIEWHITGYRVICDRIFPAARELVASEEEIAQTCAIPTAFDKYPGEKDVGTKGIDMEIYLDNAATTKVCAPAAEAAYDCMINCYGNPSSLHKKGLDAEKRVTAARKILADALSAKPEEIVFTAGSTESTHIAIRGLLAARKRGGRKIITTGIEHSAVKNTLAEMEKLGYEIVTIPPRADGHYDPMDFALAVDRDTVLVTVMLVNNETGLLLPCDKIGKLIKRANPEVIFHIDATQALGKMKLTPGRWQADMMSFSGHKIYAPKGIGALYLRKGLRIESPVVGGGQESGLRSGTHNVPGIAAFGAALEWILPQMEHHRALYESLKQRLIDGVSDLPMVMVNSNEHCVPWIVNLSVVGYRSEILLHYLEAHEVYVSSGSACSVGKMSGVLETLGITDKRADGALRISFSYETTPDQIDTLCALLHKAVTELAH